jgi:NAD(P)-dependent dehydrogenase (short-subunit alcohol dehydrogenase family)
MSTDAGASNVSPSSQHLSGHVALITGGARGIGFEIAKTFAAHGAALALCDLGCERDGTSPDPKVVEQAATQLRETGAKVWATATDVRDGRAVEEMFDAATAALGTVDILVNNAGIIADKSLFDLSEEAWDAVISTHLRGSFLCTQAVARRLRKARTRGSIINMTSTSGMLGNLGQINESSAKAGIYGLTRTSSIELQKFGIRVNALAAIAKTRLTEDLPMFEKVGNTLDARHIAPAALFLASALADDLSGTVLSVAGGRISTFELAESQGRIKEADDGIWTPEEIAENYDSIARR